MTNRESLYRSLSRAAWGYFFLNFDFNIGTVSLFPRFVGYILFFLAIETLAEERRDLRLLRPLCVLLAAWNGGDWLMSWGGGDIDGHILFLDLLVAAAGLYFQFQLLTDLAGLAELHRPSEDNDLDARLRRRRTAYIVLTTAVSLSSAYRPGQAALGEARWSWAVLALALAAMIASLMIMAGLFELRKFFLPAAPEETGEEEV